MRVDRQAQVGERLAGRQEPGLGLGPGGVGVEDRLLRHRPAGGLLEPGHRLFARDESAEGLEQFPFRLPDFGRLDGFDNRVYYLQGLSGHGLALTGLSGKLVAEAMAGDASRFDVFARLKHRPFPGGPALRTPALVLGMAYYRLRDML